MDTGEHSGSYRFFSTDGRGSETYLQTDKGFFSRTRESAGFIHDVGLDFLTHLLIAE